MKVWVTGAAGQVGLSLRHIGLDAQFFSRQQLDILSLNRRSNAITEGKPDLIINLAAYTNVDGAESDPGRAFSVNADGPRLIAENCDRIGCGLIHVSTDYVFDGVSGPYTENRATDPINLYGESKLEGEIAIRRTLERHQIFRTSWVFGPDSPNFARNILKAAEANEELHVVDDQIGGPTPARALAVSLRVAAQNFGSFEMGTYHLSGEPYATWFDLAKTLVEKTEIPCVVKPRSTKPNERPAKRPSDSRMDCSKIRREMGIQIFWQDYLHNIIAAHRKDTRISA